MCDDKLPGEMISTTGGRLSAGGGIEVEVVVGVGFVVDVDPVAVVTVVDGAVVVVVGFVVDVVVATVVDGTVVSGAAVDEEEAVEIAASVAVVSAVPEVQAETMRTMAPATVADLLHLDI